MSHSIEELTETFLQNCNEAGESERRVLERLTKRLHISRNANRDYEETLTVGQRLADRIAIFGGSWTFILIFLSLLLSWVVLNTVVLARFDGGFDPYPYIFLNLILSMLAALQAPVIMMSQNRHSAKDRAAAEHDYEVNLKAELEILALHQKIDDRHATRKTMGRVGCHAAASNRIVEKINGRTLIASGIDEQELVLGGSFTIRSRGHHASTEGWRLARR